MKILTTVLLLLSISFSAQNHRFIYEYTFVKDSLEKDKTLSENMYLDITGKGSKYYSYDTFQADSLMNAVVSRFENTGVSNVNFGGMKIKGVIRSTIFKYYPDFKITQYEKLGMDIYKMEDQRKIIWKIYSETEKIGNYMAQKATTEMFGRKWIAWFSTELPFQDGPYKFHGLPGLIVKIEDSSKTHSMELSAVETLPSAKELVSDSPIDTINKLIELDYAKFKKTFQNYRRDPMASTRLRYSGAGTTIELRDSNGKVLDKNKSLRESEEKAKKAISKNNNILELDLLKN